MAVKVKVLLVDDNPTVLAMLSKAVASAVATVTTATDAADALLRVVDEPFDLVVSDFQMAGMDGRQLLQKIKARPATAAIPVVLMASKADITEKLRSSMQDTVEDFIEKPFFLREATQRIKRLVDRIALEKMARDTPAADGVLRGSLAQMNVIDLLQSLELGRKSCMLTISRSGERSDLYFSEGQIYHAACGALKGEKAVFKIVAWTEGNFQIDFKGHSPEHTTSMSTQALLMEGLRLLDEVNRESEESGRSEPVAEAEATASSTAQPSRTSHVRDDEEDNVLEA